ncbi:hypothetical protein R1sor_016140 [Riccia sorocarpa]|uniref:Tocopherol cyclase n=1 Tax=Riccia sorocarpa TaxID=122646 RepID=A0ABD3HIC1_9MARC
MAASMPAMNLGIRRPAYPAVGRRSSLNCRAEAENVPVSSSKSDAGVSNGTKLGASPPFYTVTPVDRPTRTPHSGYHFDGSSRRFFEGWYFKVSIPEVKDGFAWMYSVEDPGSYDRTTGGLEGVVSGPKFPGVGAQVMGANDGYLFQYDKDVQTFWGSRHELSLGHTFVPKAGKAPPRCEVNPKEFLERVDEGFQVTPTWHQGYLRDNGRSPYVKTVDTIRWEYSTKPIYGWGDVGGEQKATAGWLAAFPVFEPHWQVCMAGGLSTGWIEWGDKRYEFEDAPSYSEKNWGGSFPNKWFWVQCNVFEGAAGDIALTAGGGRRGLPLLPGSFEEVAMVGIHYDGRFYEFVPWAGTVEWDISLWGSWKMTAENKFFKVKLEAISDVPGVTLRAPTADQGIAPLCKDTFFGKLKLQLWERSVSGADKCILDVTSDMAALEVGGGPWYTAWRYKSTIQDPLRTLVGLPVNVEKVFGSIPELKPPGL